MSTIMILKAIGYRMFEEHQKFFAELQNRFMQLTEDQDALKSMTTELDQRFDSILAAPMQLTVDELKELNQTYLRIRNEACRYRFELVLRNLDI